MILRIVMRYLVRERMTSHQVHTDVEAGGLIMQAHTTTSTGDGPQDDFKSNSSFSVDDQDMADATK